MHNHSHHNHDHDHRCHAHAHSHNNSLKILLSAIFIILIYAVIEAIGGWKAHSLALLGDAGHMLSDSLALSIAAFAAWIAKKPPSSTHSYGMGRAEILAAWLSSAMMLIISIFIIIKAIERIRSPITVNAAPVILIAAIGILINIIVAWMLTRTENTLNIRAALLHVLSDLLGSFAAFIAGIVIYFMHWYPIDPILSILIGVLIAIGSIRLLRESLRILMEAVPAHIDLNNVSRELKKIEGIKKIHDLHVWTLSSGNIALSAHVDIHEISCWQLILNKLSKMLGEKFNIHHITLQPEADVFDCKPCHNIET